MSNIPSRGELCRKSRCQMELYLRWLAKHEQQPNEDPPLGLILCAGKSAEQIELLELDCSGIQCPPARRTAAEEEVARRPRDVAGPARRQAGGRKVMASQHRCNRAPIVAQTATVRAAHLPLSRFNFTDSFVAIIRRPARSHVTPPSGLDGTEWHLVGDKRD